MHKDSWKDKEEMHRSLVLFSEVVVCLGMGHGHIQTLSFQPTFLLRTLQWPFSVFGAKSRFLPWPVVSLACPFPSLSLSLSSHSGFQALPQTCQVLSSLRDLNQTFHLPVISSSSTLLSTRRTLV